MKAAVRRLNARRDRDYQIIAIRGGVLAMVLLSAEQQLKFALILKHKGIKITCEIESP